jgi:Domain of unknown function (DUF4288)
VVYSKPLVRGRAYSADKTRPFWEESVRLIEANEGENVTAIAEQTGMSTEESYNTMDGGSLAWKFERAEVYGFTISNLAY